MRPHSSFEVHGSHFAAVLAAACTALVMLAGPAWAQYPPGGPVVAVSDNTVVPGQQLTVSGDGWLPNSTVTFTFFSEATGLGSAPVDADGSFSAQVTIPADADPGPHRLVTTGTSAAGTPASVELQLTVLGSDGSGGSGGDGSVGSGSGGGLAFTGLNTLGAGLLGLGLLAVGATALGLSRRRRRAGNTA